MSSVRAFLAIPLDTQLLASLRTLQEQLKTQAEGIRWSRAENLHLTLHFFGDLEQENLEKIKVSMLSVKRCNNPFLVDIKGLGAFPSLHRSRVIWLGLDPQAQLRKLHQDFQRSLKDVGLSPDTRSYTPHLTIGRARKKPADLTAQSVTLSDTTIAQLYIDRLILYESRLQPGGAEHIPLFTVNLDDEHKNPNEPI